MGAARVSNGRSRHFDYDEIMRPGRERHLLRLPRLLTQAFRLTFRASPRTATVFTVLQLLIGVGIALQLLVARSVLSTVLRAEEGFALSDVVPELLALTAVSAMVGAGNAARVEQQRLLSEHVSLYSLGQVIDVATSVDLLSFEDPDFHDRLQRARLNAVVRPVQMTTGALGMVSSLFAIGGIAVALLLVQPLFLLFVLVAFAPLWVVATRTGAAVHDFAVRQTARERLRTYLFQLLTDKVNATEVRAFALGRLLRSRHDALASQRLSDLRVLVRRRLRSGLLASVGAAVLTGLTLGVLVSFVSSGRLDLAGAGTAAVALVLLGTRLQALVTAAGAVYESSLFLEDVTSFTASLPEGGEQADRPQVPLDWKVLRVEDVAFCYPSRTSPSLRGISVEVRRGEVVALVGENGSGKTTLAKVLAGLYQPTSGRVLVDGGDRGAFEPASVRAQVGLVLQDFVRYRLTATDNIAFGRPGEEVVEPLLHEAARRADAHEMLAGLPNGYATELGPEYLGGSDLSGGQWQRIALARAFYRDAPLLVLDEPTAALDARAEAALFERIRELQRHRTVVLVSHRFSSVRAADRIYVLHEGLVVESGTHEELMAHGGRYAELYDLQASTYLAEPLQ